MTLHEDAKKLEYYKHLLGGKALTQILEDAKKWRESKIKRCPDCNNDITETWNFCRKCGWDGLCHA